jgi:predicted phosphodiesterase
VTIDGPAKVLSLSDVHIPYHDERALTAAVEYGRKKFKPDVVLLLGDFADFYAVSRWEKDPKKRNFVSELGVVEDCLRWLRGAFPKARIIYKEGNHEERYTHFIWQKAPELWDLPACRLENILHLDDMGIEMVTDKRIVMAGQLPCIHGHEPPAGLTNPVNQARGAFLRMLHSTLSAHGHRSSTHTEPNLFKKETTCFSQGCLCDMHPQYMPINKWDHSFATIEVAKDGEYDAQVRRLSKDYTVRAS